MACEAFILRSGEMNSVDFSVFEFVWILGKF